MKRIVLTLVAALTICLSAQGQKKKVVYLDTLGNSVDLIGSLSIRNTGRYEWNFDESDEKVRYVKWRRTTDEEFDSLLNLYKNRSLLPEKIGQQYNYQQLVDNNGKTYTRADLTGKVLVINYWFVGCGPCEVEMPELNELVEKYKDNNDVIFFSFAKSSKSKVAGFLEKKSFSYPVISMTDEQVKEFKIRYYPTNYVIDKNGTYCFASHGIGAGGVHLLDNAIQKALNKN